jgi:hypothetical protein
VAKQKFDTSFNFGANARPKKGKPKGRKGDKPNAWAAYTTGGRRR